MQVLQKQDNQIIIEEYLKAQLNEVNIASTTALTIKCMLLKLSKFHNNKLFNTMTAKGLFDYMSSLRKPEPMDPLHRWIGAYNTYLIHIVKFMKWLYYPDMASGKRPKPGCVKHLQKLRRKEKSVYKPTDLWTIEDDLLFLKYCPNKRGRAYHAIARDSSCRPDEILKLKIKDVVFKLSGNKQYAEVLVNGKTGTRHIPLINCIPYLKDWLDNHPMRTNPNAALICGFG